MDNYINMCFKQAKLNIEWFFVMLGCECSTDKKYLQKMLENECAPIVPTDNFK